jgi:hypothetical protein
MISDYKMEVEIINLGECRPEKSNEGLLSAIRVAKNLGCNITVLIGSKVKYPMSLIQYFLSESEAELLQKKEHVVLKDGSVLVLESKNTIIKSIVTPILFVVYGWSDVIPKIKRAVGVKSLIVLAPNDEEAAIWRKEFL